MSSSRNEGASGAGEGDGNSVPTRWTDLVTPEPDLEDDEDPDYEDEPVEEDDDDDDDDDFFDAEDMQHVLAEDEGMGDS